MRKVGTSKVCFRSRMYTRMIQACVSNVCVPDDWSLNTTELPRHLTHGRLSQHTRHYSNHRFVRGRSRTTMCSYVVPASQCCWLKRVVVFMIAVKAAVDEWPLRGRCPPVPAPNQCTVRLSHARADAACPGSSKWEDASKSDELRTSTLSITAADYETVGR